MIKEKKEFFLFEAKVFENISQRRPRLKFLKRKTYDQYDIIKSHFRSYKREEEKHTEIVQETMAEGFLNMEKVMNIQRHNV